MMAIVNEPVPTICWANAGKAAIIAAIAATIVSEKDGVLYLSLMLENAFGKNPSRPSASKIRPASIIITSIVVVIARTAARDISTGSIEPGANFEAANSIGAKY